MAGYLTGEYVFPIVWILTKGRESLEDSRETREDAGLQETLSLRRMPAIDATGDWLWRNGHNVEDIWDHKG